MCCLGQREVLAQSVVRHTANSNKLGFSLVLIVWPLIFALIARANGTCTATHCTARLCTRISMSVVFLFFRSPAVLPVVGPDFF